MRRPSNSDPTVTVLAQVPSASHTTIKTISPAAAMPPKAMKAMKAMKTYETMEVNTQGLAKINVAVSLTKNAERKKAMKKFDLDFYGKTGLGVWVKKHNEQRWKPYEVKAMKAMKAMKKK